MRQTSSAFAWINDAAAADAAWCISCSSRPEKYIASGHSSHSVRCSSCRRRSHGSGTPRRRRAPFLSPVRKVLVDRANFKRLACRRTVRRRTRSAMGIACERSSAAVRCGGAGRHRAAQHNTATGHRYTKYSTYGVYPHVNLKLKHELKHALEEVRVKKQRLAVEQARSFWDDRVEVERKPSSARRAAKGPPQWW